MATERKILEILREAGFDPIEDRGIVVKYAPENLSARLAQFFSMEFYALQLCRRELVLLPFSALTAGIRREVSLRLPYDEIRRVTVSEDLLNYRIAIETGEDGRVSGLRVQPQIIGEPRRGRPAPRAAATPERVIPCERVFVAIGQDIDSKPFEDMGIVCKWGRVVTDSDGAVPNFDGLFSGGDCQTGPATVIRAINAGRVASANIDRYLGFDHKIKLDVELPTVQFKGKHECGRCELGEREAGERIRDWNLVEQGLTEEEARQEASRCLRCDHFGFGAFRGGRNLEW